METLSALLAICTGNAPITGEFHALRPVTRSFDVFFDLRLNKRLTKQSWGWWFETPLDAHYDAIVMIYHFALSNIMGNSYINPYGNPSANYNT